MNGQEVSVRFTETFLTASKEFLGEDDLRAISLKLSLESHTGKQVEGVDNLRSLPCISLESHAHYRIWYLAYADIPHIEVVGFSRGDAKHSVRNAKDLAFKVARIGAIFRSAYNAYQFAKDNLTIWH